MQNIYKTKVARSAKTGRFVSVKQNKYSVANKIVERSAKSDSFRMGTKVAVKSYRNGLIKLASR